MKKWLKYGLLATLVLLFLGVITLVVCLDGIIKASTEKALGFATECDSTLDKASLNPLSGHLKLSGLEIKNPKAFDQAHPFVHFNTTEVQLQPASLVSDKIEIDTVVLDGLEFSYVKPAEGKDNVQTVLDSVNRLLPQGDPNAPQKEAPKEKSPSNKAIHVGVVKFADAKVHVSWDLGLGAAPVKLDVPLPAFEVRNVEVKGGMPELTSELVKDIGAQLVKQAPEIGKAVAESAKANYKNIAEENKGLIDAAKGFKNPFKK